MRSALIAKSWLKLLRPFLYSQSLGSGMKRLIVAQIRCNRQVDRINVLTDMIGTKYSSLSSPIVLVYFHCCFWLVGKEVTHSRAERRINRLRSWITQSRLRVISVMHNNSHLRDCFVSDCTAFIWKNKTWRRIRNTEKAQVILKQQRNQWGRWHAQWNYQSFLWERSSEEAVGGNAR